MEEEWQGLEYRCEKGNMCCSMLQHIAVCCSVLQCVASGRDLSIHTRRDIRERKDVEDEHIWSYLPVCSAFQ